MKIKKPENDTRKLRTFFEAITRDRATHALFLNTLSFLEYVGSRKIMKSQAETSIDADLLAHIAEEIRHAQFFKKMALTLSDGALKDYSPSALWEGQRAWRYFQGVDQACARILGKEAPALCYLLTTYGIEVRALLAYGLYLDYVTDDGHRRLLSGIIKEERVHLVETEAALAAAELGPELLEQVVAAEAKLFWEWMDEAEIYTQSPAREQPAPSLAH